MREERYNPVPSENSQPISHSSSAREHRARRLVFRVGVVAGVALILALGLRFPQELSTLRERRQEIRQLHEENNNLRKLRDERLERLRRLKEKHQDLDLEIRREYHLLKPGENMFIVPPATSGESAAPPASSGN